MENRKLYMEHFKVSLGFIFDDPKAFRYSSFFSRFSLLFTFAIVPFFFMFHLYVKNFHTFYSVVIPTFNQFFHIRWNCTCASLVSLQISSHVQPTFNEEIFPICTSLANRVRKDTSTSIFDFKK